VYWHGDPLLARSYREAYDLEQKRDIQMANWNAWLAGRYIYDAILACAPVFNAFAKHPRPAQYHKEPFKLSTDESADEHRSISKEEQEMKVKSAKVAAWATKFNARFKGGNSNAG